MSNLFWAAVIVGGVVVGYRLVFQRFPWEPLRLTSVRLASRPTPMTTRLAEDHVRGQLVTPQTWRGSYGSVLQGQVTGTFNGSVGAGLYLDSQMLSPEKTHVTPQIEAALAQSAHRRTWFGGGQTPPVQGTFG